MGLETASYISQLNTSNPLSTDGIGQADDHIRLIKAVLKATFPDANGAINLRQIIPIGTITAWAPSAGSIPSGWAECNGQTVSRTDGGGNITTPDLRDKFIVAAGSTRGAGTSGGSLDTSASGAHTHTGFTGSHTLTVAQIPSHNHSATADTQGGHDHRTTTAIGWGLGTRGSGATPAVVVEGPDNWRTDWAGSHSHNITVNNQGGGGGHNHSISSDGSHTHTILPTYYAMKFIMKH